jgi:hypothetical protein
MEVKVTLSAINLGITSSLFGKFLALPPNKFLRPEVKKFTKQASVSPKVGRTNQYLTSSSPQYIFKSRIASSKI